MEKNPLRLLIGPWLPDQADFLNEGSPNCRNVYPRTVKSYGPVASPVPYSGALDARCQGAVAYLDNLGNVNLFAGTKTKLWRLVAGSVNWTDVSKVGGYNCSDTAEWQFNYFNGTVIANNYSDPIQKFTIASDAAFSDLSATAPKARYAAVVANFLMTAGTFDATDQDQPQRAWWSGANDATSWPTPGTNAAAQVQSSFNTLLGDNGFITGVVGDLGNADGAIFMERGVFRVIYAGPPNIFSFPRAEGVVGCVAPGSIVTYGNVAYYLGPDGWRSFDGGSGQPIGEGKFDKTFYADLDQTNITRIVGTIDAINKLLIWAYPGQGNVNGNPNRLLLYSPTLQRASIVDMTCETIARMLSVGYTLDQLYTVLGYSLDNLPAPLDSRVWTGGSLLLGTFDTNHKLNYLTGQNLAPTVDTSEQQPFPGRRWFCKGVRPLVDGGAPSVAVGRRETLQSAVQFTSAAPINGLGTCKVRTSGRYGRARITLPAGSTFSHILGVEIEGGERGIR